MKLKKNNDSSCLKVVNDGKKKQKFVNWTSKNILRIRRLIISKRYNTEGGKVITVDNETSALFKSETHKR